jgi:hypothetical protein
VPDLMEAWGTSRLAWRADVQFRIRYGTDVSRGDKFVVGNVYVPEN